MGYTEDDLKRIRKSLDVKEAEIPKTPRREVYVYLELEGLPGGGAMLNYRAKLNPKNPKIKPSFMDNDYNSHCSNLEELAEKCVEKFGQACYISEVPKGERWCGEKFTDNQLKPFIRLLRKQAVLNILYVNKATTPL